MPITISRPGGATIYFRQSGSDIQYSIDNQATWTALGANFPITITNTNTSAGVLAVEFVNNITIDNTNISGNSKYFVCGSGYIQFGSKSLNPNGSRPVITIAVGSYDGLIQNGGEATPGNANIYVYNLIVDASGRTPQIGAGWIGQKGFGNSVANNYIVNCSSTGDLPGGAVGSGGIVGAFAGIGTGAQLYIYGCFSSGAMGQLDGGIVGAFAGQGGGSVICEQCWSTGVIGDFAGGIFGDYAGNTGSATATKCYSIGAIGISSGNAGGIFGRYAGYSGQAIAQSCYSRGDIATYGGGIFGLGAALGTGGFTRAINCYSIGAIGFNAGGIYGSGKGSSGQTTNCYAGDGGWVTSAANLQLQGVPSGIVGITWISTGTNQPYELNAMGYTPYSRTIIGSTSQLIQIYNQTVTAGQSTVTALTADASGNSFVVLQIIGGDSGSYGTIKMSQQTGAISTTSATVPGIYTITLRSTGSYNITTFSLTVTTMSSTGEVIQVPCCALPSYVTGDDYDIQADTLAGNAIIANFPFRRGPISYSALLKMKIANASKRR